MQNNIVEKVLDILIDARNRNLTMGNILHSDCRYFAGKLIANDVVPVVRCCKCIYFKTNTSKENYCNMKSTTWDKFYVRPDDYCSYGERKNDNGKM